MLRLHHRRFQNLRLRFQIIFFDLLGCKLLILNTLVLIFGMFRDLLEGFNFLVGFQSILGGQVLLSTSLLNVNMKYIQIVKFFAFIFWDQTLNLFHIISILGALVFQILILKSISCLSLHHKIVCISQFGLAQVWRYFLIFDVIFIPYGFIFSLLIFTVDKKSCDQPFDQ